MEANTTVTAPGQYHEDDPIDTILVHNSGMDLSMGALHPVGSLYEKPVDVSLISEQNKISWKAFSDAGIQVLQISKVLGEGSEQEGPARDSLVEFAMQSLKYQLDNATDGTLLNEDESYLLSDSYKKTVLEQMPLSQLIDVILTRPCITLFKSDINSALATHGVFFEPLSNLMFTRDTMIVTAKGIVLAQLNSWQRAPEVDVVSFVCKKLGLKVLGQVPLPGRIEGSDYFPSGEDLCFFGLGVRTNYTAVQWLMSHDLIGTTRVAVVQDLFDRNSNRVWLEKVFNFVGDKEVVVSHSVLNATANQKRLVDEYTKTNGEYVLTRRSVDFIKYLEEQGFAVIPITECDEYDCSSLINIGQGRIMTGSPKLAQELQNSPLFKGTVTTTADKAQRFNGIHSTTAVISRKKVTRQHLQPHVRTELPPLPQPLRGNEPLQSSNMVVMIAPTSFYQNLAAAKDNYFMVTNNRWSKQRIQHEALREYSELYAKMTNAGVSVVLFSHAAYHGTPDAVFPNNWFSTHSAAELGRKEPLMVLYPMKVPNRRLERRPDIIREIECLYPTVTTLADNEMYDEYLEGTGSLVLDRVHRRAYVSTSERSHASIAKLWAKKFGYELILFKSTDAAGRPIYHTNVMMAIGTNVAVVCLECVENPEERRTLHDALSQYHQVIPITRDQVSKFCGNILEVRGGHNGEKKLMVMSSQAYNAFTHAQILKIHSLVDDVIHTNISTIESIGGGGVRCCIAELF